MNKKLKMMKLIKIYGECLDLENQLRIKLQELGKIASEIYGEVLTADICVGSEIEFRKLDKDGYVDADSTVLIEEIIANKGKEQ